MSKDNKKAPKIYATVDKVKFELKGKRFCYQGKKYTAAEAAKNEELMALLVLNQSPAVEKV